MYTRSIIKANEVYSSLNTLIRSLRDSSKIIVKLNDRLSYETKGYRIWIRKSRNTTTIEYTRTMDLIDIDSWYTGVYLGSTIAGKYTKKLIALAIIIAGIIIIINASLIHLVIVITGSLIVLDYILHIYRGWRLIRDHKLLLDNNMYMDTYSKLKSEIFKLINLARNCSIEYTYTMTFMDKTWFTYCRDGDLILSKTPVKSIS